MLAKQSWPVGLKGRSSVIALLRRRNMTQRATMIGLVLVGVLALAGGWGLGVWLFGERTAPAPEISGIYLRDFQPLDQFRLTHHSGQPFTGADLRGQWSFLYFGYSFCPDVCPLTLAEMDRLQKVLAAQGADQETAYLFISVDPQRDTPERLSEYVRFFNPKFQGVTGPDSELERLAKPLRVFYQRGSNPEKTNSYTVDHTSTITLIDPTGRPRAIFTPPQNPEQMAADFIKIRQAAP